MKTCPKCKKDLPMTKEFFYASRQRRDGFCWCCKACHSAMTGKAHVFPSRPARYAENTKFQRRCSTCENVFPLTDVNFHRSKACRSGGFNYICKKCSSENSKRLNGMHKNRLKVLLRGYKVSDAKATRNNDITVEFLESFLLKNTSCTYCGRVGVGIGLDRVNNAEGHVKTNVVPSCVDCNRIRGDNLSHTEMLKLGTVLRDIYDERCVDE